MESFKTYFAEETDDAKEHRRHVKEVKNQVKAHLAKHGLEVSYTDKTKNGYSMKVHARHDDPNIERIENQHHRGRHWKVIGKSVHGHDMMSTTPEDIAKRRRDLHKGDAAKHEYTRTLVQKALKKSPVELTHKVTSGSVNWDSTWAPKPQHRVHFKV